MKRQNGHSLIEMLVVLIIVGVIIAITVPAVQRSRESARQTQCLSQQRQLALAVHAHVSKSPFGRYPGFRALTEDGESTIGWAAQLFEHLGRHDLDPTEGTYLEVLVCPSNQGPIDSPRLNYVVNGGQSGSDSPADGVFFDHTRPLAERVYITKEDFRDGLSNTILLAENLDATDWTATDEASQCILWPLSPGNEINDGTGARPSSHHPGGFVAAFADGRAKFMQESELNDDPAVHTADSLYVAYLTPGGNEEFPTIVDGVDPCDQPDAGTEVNIGLDWIAAHQSDDGSWSLKHSTHPDCNGQCPNNSTMTDTRIAATGLALLPLLGSGSAPGSGPYAENICMGLEYLMARQGADGSLAEIYLYDRAMYSHLLAMTAMIEGVALASDVVTVGGCEESESGPDVCHLSLDELKIASQKAIDWLVLAEAPVNSSAQGGWRYTIGGHDAGSPTGPVGDLSHHLWAVSALLTAQRQGLSVPDSVIANLSTYLDSVELEPRITDQGITLGDYRYYAGPNPPYGQVTVSMTTSGLLCRTLLGAPVSHPKIVELVDSISPAQGEGEMYFKLHATQLLHRVGGSQWETWNTEMQQVLLAAQEQSGHARGSFFWSDSAMDSRAALYNARGGRLYCTAFALLCLEQNFSRLKLSKVGA